MTRWPLHAAGVVVAAAIQVLVIRAGEAHAAPFRLGSWGGTLEGFVEFLSNDTEAGDSQRTTSENLFTQERFTIRNAGAHLYDPRLLSLTVEGVFGLSHEERDRGDGDKASDTGSLLGYEASLSFLSRSPFSLDLFATRSETSPTQPAAGRTEITSEARGATFFAERLYIPSRLSIRQDLVEQETTTAGNVVARRNDERRRLTYDGQRGWTDSEIDVRYELVDEIDKVVPDTNFQSHEVNLRYSLDFGTELNRHLNSSLRHFTRKGVAEQTTSSASGRVAIEHSADLQTRYGYSFSRNETSGGASTRHTGSASLRHRLFRSLSTKVGLGASIQTLPRGQEDTFRGSLGFSYRKRLPGNGTLAAGLAGGLVYDDGRFDDTESFIPQETHTFDTPFAFPIALDNLFVITSSVLVTKVAAGPLPPGCIAPPGPPTPLEPGRDYTLQAVGNVAEIVPIPCDGAIPGINPGDTIAVDYGFTVAGSRAFATGTWRADASIDYGWVKPYFVHEQTEQTLQSGSDGEFLDDQRSDTAGVELSYALNRLGTSIRVEARRLVSDRICFESIRSVESATISILPGLSLRLISEQSRIDFQKPKRFRETVTGRANLTYSFKGSLFVDAVGAIRFLENSDVQDERTANAALRVRWLFRKVELRPTVEFFDRDREETGNRELRTAFYAVRRF